MTNKTITRPDLVEAIRQEVGLSQAECGELLEATLDKITDSLVKGDPVKITGFASFSLRHKKERIGRNPRTGVGATILPRTVVVFTASNMLKDLMNQQE
ncbi:MAG: integration host factor subunit alpha [Rhodospirillales bacterium]|jgi:integration host factor subunit alpha|nr:integration host factor subunit alpha [Rhodospirillales bacterium]